MHCTLPTALSIIFASIVMAVNSEDVAFLTALASDFKANPQDYIEYIATGSVPEDLTSLALRIKTYKDDSFTTLLQDASSQVREAESFATHLPWFSRLNVAAEGESGDDSSNSATPSGSGSRAVSTSAGAGSTSFVAPIGAILGAAAVALL